MIKEPTWHTRRGFGFRPYATQQTDLNSLSLMVPLKSIITLTLKVPQFNDNVTQMKGKTKILANLHFRIAKFDMIYYYFLENVTADVEDTDDIVFAGS
jgi:hypothetical protein